MVSMSSFTPSPFVSLIVSGRSGRCRANPAGRMDPVTSPTPQFTAPLLTPRRLAALLDAAVLDARRPTSPRPRRRSCSTSAGGSAVRPDAPTTTPATCRGRCSSTSTPSSRRRRVPAAATRCRPGRPAGGAAPCGGVAALPRGRLRRRHGCRRRAGVVAAALGRAAGRAGRGARRRLRGVGRGRSARHHGPSGRPRATSSCGPAACRWSTRTVPRSWPGTACCSTPARRRGTGARPSRSTRRPGTSRGAQRAGHRAPRPGRPLAAARRASPALRRARCRPGRRVRRRRLLRLRCQRHGRRPRLGVRGPSVRPPRSTRVPGRSGPPTPAARSRPAPRRERPRGSPGEDLGTFDRCPTSPGSPRFPTMSPRAAVVWTPEFLAYDLGGDHPLNPVRLDLTMRLARELGVLEGVELARARARGRRGAAAGAPAVVPGRRTPAPETGDDVGARPRHRRQPDLRRHARGQRAGLRRFAAGGPGDRRGPRRTAR